MIHARTGAKVAGQLIQRKGGPIVTKMDQKSCWKGAQETKNVKNNDQSRNVYENKQNADNLPPQMTGNCFQMNAM